MKESLERIRKLRDSIVGMEMQMDLVKQGISVAHHNISSLSKMERDLIFNIRFLKKDGVVVIAKEYEKSKLELKSVQKGLREYIAKYDRLLIDSDKKMKIINTLSQEYRAELKKINNERVILRFDQSKRKKK